MAVAIETNIKLMRSYDDLDILNDRLKEANSRLKITNDQLRMTSAIQEATLASIDEGIITIDRTGKIICLNKSCPYVKVRPEEAKIKISANS